jgi:alpha-N-arabinofuranosidase
MANIAQLINCIQSLFLAHEDKFLLTPTYHVFAMYAAHQGGTAVRTLMSAPPVSWKDGQGRDHSLWGLNGSASLGTGTITLTVTNPHLTEAREAEIAVRGAAVRVVSATTLAARDVHDHNTFEAPRTVVPTTAPVAAKGSPFGYRFPAASVTKLELTLGT